MKLLLLPLLFFVVQLGSQSFSSPTVFPYNTNGEVFSLEAGEAGSYYVAGSFRDSITFPGGMAGDTTFVQSEVVAFVCRFTANDELDWIRVVQNETSRVFDIHRSSTGDLFIVGSFKGIVDFGQGFTRNGGEYDTGFVWKLNEAGDIIDVRVYRSFLDQAAATRITTDAEGNLYVAGFYEDKIDVDLDPTPGSGDFLLSAVDRNLFAAKYDADFNLDWAESIGWTSSNISVRSILADDDGHAYLVGDFSGEIDFDEEPTAAAGGTDIFIAKHHPSGSNWLWYETYGGPGSEIAHDAIFTNQSPTEILISGSFTADFEYAGEEVTLDPSSEKAGFLLQHSINAQPTNSAVIDALGNVQLFDVNIGPQGNTLLFGRFSGSLPLVNGTSLTTDSLSALFVGELDFDSEFSRAVVCAEGTFFDPPFYTPLSWPEFTVTETEKLIMSSFAFGPTLVSPGPEEVTLTRLEYNFRTSYPGFIIGLNDFLLPSSANDSWLSAKEVRLYPNPGTNQLFFQTDQPLFDLQLLDISGKLLRRHPGPIQHVWNLGLLPMGTYIVRGRTEHSWFKRRYLNSKG
ncbi:hypothetical protein CEQ90_11165 [Lewinellaceae bacterium SD302]|nr:hypothetical protein CEQ90_11165 [Lewinellaceae bacterium SD302]